MAVAAALLVPLLAQPWAAPAGANIDINVRGFGNGDSEAILAFSSPGANNALTLSFQTGLRVLSASINITGMPYTPGGTDCPESPSVDLGNDGSVEWRFNGTGYGRLGQQYLFSDGNSTYRAVYGPSGGGNFKMAIRFPAGAKLSYCSLLLTPSGFSGSLNVSYDVGNDSVPDWANTALTGAATIAGIESVISAYIDSSAPSGVDSFGVKYVDVPVSIRCGSAATLTFSTLNMGYSCAIPTLNLATELDMLIPDAVGDQNVTVPLKVSSDSPGKLRLYDIRVRTQPPAHSPQLLDPLPAPDPSMDENSYLNFSVRPVDIYGNPFTLQWFIDSAPAPGANVPSFVYRTNFTSAGRHMITVTAGNGLSEAQLTWWVTVRDVNRAPVVEAFYPEGPVSVSENQAITFNVSARDPDGGDLTYKWRLDGQEQLARSSEFRYQPSYCCSGPHDVDVLVSDPGGRSASVLWCVTVVKSNAPPNLFSLSPSGDFTLREGESARFSADASDLNGDPLSFEWVVDGFHVADGKDFNFTTDYRSAGKKEIRAVVSDGEFTVYHGWNVTILDVNHPPRAVIDGPAEGAEYLDTDTIVLSGLRSYDPDMDPLILTWTDAGVPVGTGPLVNVTLAHGRHLFRLVADDGHGASDEATVNITVRSIGLNITAKVTPTGPVKGNKVKMTVRILGQGDGTARNLSLEFFVDGVPSGNRSIPRVEPGANLTEQFVWTAELGQHELMLTAGNTTLTMQMTVVEGGGQWFFSMAVLIGAATISVGTAAAYFIYLSLFEPKPRDKRSRAKARSTPTSWWGDGRPAALEKIKLENAPYKDQPLEIQTTVPDGVTQQDLVKAQLSARRRRLMDWHLTTRAQAPPAAAEAPYLASEAEGPPMAEAAFSSSAASDAVAVTDSAPAAEAAEAVREKEEPSAPKKPRKRIKDIEDRILVLERKGADVASVRRFLSLGRSFWKGGNTPKAEQYFEKAEARLAELETATQATGIPLCPTCGATVDPTWIVCPECEGKL